MLTIPLTIARSGGGWPLSRTTDALAGRFCRRAGRPRRDDRGRERWNALRQSDRPGELAFARWKVTCWSNSDIQIRSCRTAQIRGRAVGEDPRRAGGPGHRSAAGRDEDRQPASATWKDLHLAQRLEIVPVSSADRPVNAGCQFGWRRRSRKTTSRTIEPSAPPRQIRWIGASYRRSSCSWSIVPSFSSGYLGPLTSGRPQAVGRGPARRASGRAGLCIWSTTAEVGRAPGERGHRRVGASELAVEARVHGRAGRNDPPRPRRGGTAPPSAPAPGVAIGPSAPSSCSDEEVGSTALIDRIDASS